MQQDHTKFIKDFLQAEYDMIVANMTERDDKKFKAAIEHYQSFLAYKLSPSQMYVYRPFPITNEWFEKYKKQVEMYQTKPLFLVRAYENLELGTIYRCNTGSNFNMGDSDYAKSYTVATINGELKVCNEFSRNHHKPRWDWFWGIKLSSSKKKFVGVERFVEPKDPIDLEDYQSDKGNFK